MMEEYSSNLHQEEFHGGSSSSSLEAATPSFQHEYWNQDLLLSSAHDDFIPSSSNGLVPSASRDFMRLSHDMQLMVNQELAGFPWSSTCTAEEGTKDELSESLAQLGESNLPNYQYRPVDRPVIGLPPPVGDLGFDPPLADDMALMKEDLTYGLDQYIQEPASCNRQSKISPSVSGGADDRQARRAKGNCLEYKASKYFAKKPRVESHASFTSFKVRKEKLGDRIAALQQLVAPFGKTDAASVLMEAIGYIKFLQDQVEKLSVPYMRWNTKKMRTSEEISTEEGDEGKLDLRSRGLCLVPLSSTSYVTNENAGVWSPIIMGEVLEEKRNGPATLSVRGLVCPSCVIVPLTGQSMVSPSD